MKFKPESGSVILPFIVTLPFLILIATYFMNLSVTSFKLAARDQRQTQAQLAVDGGVDYALQQISLDEDWAGTGASEVELFNNGDIRTTYEVIVDTPDEDNKIVTAIGRTFRPVSDTQPESTVKLVVNLRPVRSGDYSVVTGQGGLIMRNSSKVIGGDVHINGEITMSNSAQIGLTTNPATVEVANQVCPIPPDATYPALCSASDNPNPVSISNPAQIYGDVRANHQSNGSGMSNPGLTASSGVTPEPLPSYDRDAHKAAVATEITGAAASCSGSQSRIWTANTKINGNVTLSNSCSVTVQGNIWITGNVTTSNTSRIIIDESVGTTIPTVMIDGATGLRMNQSSLIQSNSSDTGAQFITYRSTASCSPDCADVTGTDLNNSRSITTIELAQSTEAAESIFYSRWTQVSLANGGQIGAVIGQTVNMSNSATITFGTDIPGSSTTQWVIDSYRRVFD